MQLRSVLDVLRSIAPEHLAEPWDKVGLQVGDPDAQVTRALLCIDLTEAVMKEAIKTRVSLVVAYHPPIFDPLPAVTLLDPRQGVIFEAIRRGIAIYSPHTALDATAGGVNDFLIESLGQGQVRAIRPAGGSGDSGGAGTCKVVVFVPPQDADRLRSAMAEAGAGRIGAYRDCSFAVGGEGTFTGGPTTKPVVGRAGRLERVPELRMETICPSETVDAVVRAVRQAHPYEEPAIDVYPLTPAPADPMQPPVGQGRILTLDRPLRLGEVMDRLKRQLRLPDVEAAWSGRRPSSLVRTVGVCAGAGGSLLPLAGAVDVFVTGEMRHHDVLDAARRGVTLVLAGHTQTERPYLATYRKRLIAAGGKAVAWRVSGADVAPTRRG